MILLADSGSTKTTWCLLSDDGDVKEYQSAGVNPYLHSKAYITDVFKSVPVSDPRAIHYYGAGLGSDRNKKLLSSLIHEVFDIYPTTMADDLLAAARATCGEHEGLICILGTGSNAAYYNGNTATPLTTSLGFILGDEGGGARLGGAFVRDYIQGRMPAELRVQVAASQAIYTDEVLKHIYQKPSPSHYLASFARLVGQHIGHPYCQRLVRKNFERFFERMILPHLKSGREPIHFVGSIAFIYQDILTDVLHQYNLEVGTIIKEPMPGLTLYHQKSI